MEMVRITFQVPKCLQGYSAKLVTTVEFNNDVRQNIALCLPQRKNSANDIWYYTTNYRNSRNLKAILLTIHFGILLEECSYVYNLIFSDPVLVPIAFLPFSLL